MARPAQRIVAPAAADRPASAEASDRYSGAMGADLFRPDADPREAARARFSDDAQLSARTALQHPRRVHGAARRAGPGGVARPRQGRLTRPLYARRRNAMVWRNSR